MTKCCIYITPLDVSRETLQLRLIIIRNQLQVVLGGASICIIFTFVKKINKLKVYLIYMLNGCTNKND